MNNTFHLSTKVDELHNQQMTDALFCILVDLYSVYG
jgi:hypothetical protein